MRASSILVVSLGCTALLGCGPRRVAASGDVQTPYADSRTTVIGTDDSGGDVGGSTDVELVDGDCVVVGGQCVDPDAGTGAYCEAEGGPADVIVVDGAVVEVVCYPPGDGEGLVVELKAEGELELELPPRKLEPDRLPCF